MLEENNPRSNQDENSAQSKAGGYRINDDSGTEEKNLRRNPLFGQGEMQQVHEGQPMGGHHFDKETPVTPFSDDKDNPSRYAGYTNAYLARTEPMEEDTANNNFKAAHQEGQPDYDKAHVPGPQELPEQQKVGESNTSKPGKAGDKPDVNQKPDYSSQNTAQEKDHIET